MKQVQKGMEMKEAWDKRAGIQLVEATRAHIFNFTYKCFVDIINDCVQDALGQRRLDQGLSTIWL